MPDVESRARTVMERCKILSRYSEEPQHLTRRFATLAMQQVNELVMTWMEQAGLTVQRDAIGNIIGRYEASQPGARTLLLGSHLDTVRDAGKYDGPLGVLIALACLEELHAHHQRLPFAIELLAFTDEEGLRYQTTYLSSKAFAGLLEPEVLHLRDVDNIPLATALQTAGGNPEQIFSPSRPIHDLLGYCEVHIEQGPVLESLNLPVGVVSSIAGQSRVMITFTGKAGHAGTVPMSQRLDALCAAAAFITRVEQLAQSIPGLVATVGQLSVYPGASNVIPGTVTLSLDVRHQTDEQRLVACEGMRQEAEMIAQSRHLSLNWHTYQETDAVPCTPAFTHLLEKAIVAQDYPAQMLTSGAGHDAVIMSTITPIAMLFVRCKDGLSHHPDESVTVADVAVAIQVLEHFLVLLKQEQR